MELQFPGSTTSWKNRCTAFIDRVKAANPDTRIGGFIGRLRQVVDQKGKHIEGIRSEKCRCTA
jgi:hypothetical protein